MSKNTKIILHYPQYQNIITQYLCLDDFKDLAPDTMRFKRVTITSLCNFLGNNGIKSFEQCKLNHVTHFIESISALSTSTKSGKTFILRHFFNFLVLCQEKVQVKYDFFILTASTDLIS